jgi:ribosome-binding protein aMBF1 (putative translation factor)
MHFMTRDAPKKRKARGRGRPKLEDRTNAERSALAELGRLVAAAREKDGRSLRALSADTGLAVLTIHEIEHGLRDPGFLALRTLCAALKVKRLDVE